MNLPVDAFVANVAESLIARRANKLVVFALLWIDCFARGTFCAPLDVNKRTASKSHKLLDHLIRQRCRQKTLRRFVLWIILEMHLAFSLPSTSPAHPSETLRAL
jgi:hypothetical protein